MSEEKILNLIESLSHLKLEEIALRLAVLQESVFENKKLDGVSYKCKVGASNVPAFLLENLSDDDSAEKLRLGAQYLVLYAKEAALLLYLKRVPNFNDILCSPSKKEKIKEEVIKDTVFSLKKYAAEIYKSL